jgi:hypothetical protein
MKKIGLLVLLLALLACDETELDFPFDGDGTQIEIYLVKEDAMDYYNAEDFETTASDFIRHRWYARLVPGKSMTRTVTPGGYKPLPSGNVNTRFRFPGNNRLDAGEWKQSDGRIWVGAFNAEAELNLP